MLAHNPVTLEQVSRLQEFHKRLDATVQHYLNTGVAVCTDQIGPMTWHERIKFARKTTTIGAPTSMAKFVKQVARDIKRPIIVVCEKTHIGVSYIATVKRTKAMYQVVLPTMLGAEEKPRYHRNSKEPVTWRKDTTNWYISFTGDKGQEALATFIECCRTMHRSALKLDQPIP